MLRTKQKVNIITHSYNQINSNACLYEWSLGKNQQIISSITRLIKILKIKERILFNK